MPLPGNRTLNTADLTAYTPSCGASPVAAYVRAPFRCRLLKVTGILGGVITTADGTVTVTVNAAPVASFAVAQAGSAAGQFFSAVRRRTSTRTMSSHSLRRAHPAPRCRCTSHLR